MAIKISPDLLSVMAALLGFIFSLGAPRAQTTSTGAEAGGKARFEHDVFAVGLNASLVTGMGVSFKHHVAKVPWAYQITVGPWKGAETLFTLGGELQYDLSVGESDRAYALFGGGYYYQGVDHNRLLSELRYGLGVGYELPIGKAFNLALNGLISFFPNGIFNDTGFKIYPLPSLALQGYFH